MNQNEEMTTAQQEMKIYEDAVEKFGAEDQIIVAIEELSELTKALCKYLRYGPNPEILASIQEERADVEIMLNQLHVIFGDCSDQEVAKLERLRGLLNEEQ